jgi:endonuclease/exonuclease/phosphatase family metal-dependent hydrolase
MNAVLVVATWNLENLFRPGSEYGPRTTDIYVAKLDALAATIEAIAPDVLAIQELGDDAALDDLLDRLTGEWSTARSTAADHRGIRVGFVSRLAIAGEVDIVEFPAELADVQADDGGALTTRMGRGGLLVRVVTPGGIEVELVTVHLKSKLISYPDGRFAPRDEDERARYGAYALFRRAAEAATVRSFVNDRLAGQGEGRAVVLLGDCNDTVEAATTQILLGPGGSELGTAGADRPDEGDAWRMWNLAPLIPAAQRYSRIYRGRGELIDHIFVSRALRDLVTDARAVVEPPLPSVHDDPRARRDAPASDHAPVVARLDV